MGQNFEFTEKSTEFESSEKKFSLTSSLPKHPEKPIPDSIIFGHYIDKPEKNETTEESMQDTVGLEIGPIELTPLSWDKFWTEKKFIKTEQGEFCTYFAGDVRSLLFGEIFSFFSE